MRLRDVFRPPPAEHVPSIKPVTRGRSLMEQQRPRIIRAACTHIRLVGSLGGDTSQVTQTFGGFLPPGSVERSDTGLLCVRRRLVAPPRRLLGVSETMRRLVTRYGRS